MAQSNSEASTDGRAWARTAIAPLFAGHTDDVAREIVIDQWAAAYDRDPAAAAHHLRTKIEFEAALRELDAAGRAHFGEDWPGVARDLELPVEND